VELKDSGPSNKRSISPARPKPQQPSRDSSPVRVTNNGNSVPVVSIQLDDSDDESTHAVGPVTTTTTSTITATTSSNDSNNSLQLPPSARKRSIIATLFGSFLSSSTKSKVTQSTVTSELTKVSIDTLTTITNDVPQEIEVSDDIPQATHAESPPSSPDEDLQFSVRMLSTAARNHEVSPISHLMFSPTPLKSPTISLSFAADKVQFETFSYIQIYFKPFLQAYFCHESNVHDAPYHSVDEQELVLWTTYQLYGKHENSIIASSIRLSSIVKAIHESASKSKQQTVVMKKLRSITAPSLEQTMRQVPYTEDRRGYSSPSHRGHKDTSLYSIFNYEKYKWILRQVVPVLIDKNASTDATVASERYSMLLNILKQHVDTTYTIEKKLSYQVVFNQSRICICGFIRPQCSVVSGSSHGDYASSTLTSMLDLTRERAGSSSSMTNRVACKLWGVFITERDIRYVKTHIWDRNYEQIRHIYSFYTDVHGPRHQGSGLNGYLLSYERCREMLHDFDVIPSVVDNHTLSILFQSCKIWEWNMAAIVYTHNHQHPNPVILDAYSAPLPEDMQGFQPYYPDINDHQNDFNLSVGNFALTLTGFIELLTRIGCNNGKLSAVPAEAMNMLLHIMNRSNGTAKMANANRRSVQVRKFDVTK